MGISKLDGRSQFLNILMWTLRSLSRPYNKVLYFMKFTIFEITEVTLILAISRYLPWGFVNML